MPESSGKNGLEYSGILNVQSMVDSGILDINRLECVA